MSYVTINGNVNGNVTIIVNNGAKMDTPQVSEAKDKLVELLYKKRDWDKFNGREGWARMRYLYEMREYDQLRIYLYGLPETGSKNKALSYLSVIAPVHKPKKKNKKRR
jgi:hypothetical protein